jgi:hypothetical protein
MVQDRYLYHCFPRRGANTTEEIAKGVKILTCIRDFGLLLLPESIEWSQPVTNQPPRTIPVIQSRVCFTDLTPVELPEHATTFGHFALEFDIESARQLGAIPVFYVPQKDGGVGASLVTILLDARAIIDRAAIVHKLLTGETPVNDRFALTTGFARNPQDKRTFDIHRDESKAFLEALNHQATPWPMLSTGLDALLGFFYPADNTIHNKPLQYYQQREWRIACNFAIDGVEVLRKPSEEEVRRISQIDEQFFRKPIQTDHGPVERLDRALIHPGIGGKTALQMARRLIVPASAIEQSRELLKDMQNAPEVIAMEDLA